MKRKNTKSHTAFARRRFLVEGLEPRCMLAGNVNVFVSGGTLFVTGDNSDNAVLIQQEDNGVYSVTGLNFDTDLGIVGEGFAAGDTKINNVDSDAEPILFSGVTNDINVNLGKGNDALGIGNDIEQLNSLAVDCFGMGFLPPDDGGSGDGSGGNEITPDQLDATLVVPRNLIVNLGDGNDFTAIAANVGSLNSNGTIKKGGVASINLGNGTNGAAYGDSDIADDLLITGGTGNDNACVTDVGVNDLLSIQLGDGAENDVDADEFDAGHLLVITGKGNDNVLLSDFDVTHELTVLTGAGNDQLEVEDFDAASAVINTGDGNDGSPGDDETPEISPAIVSLDSPITVSSASITGGLTLVTGNGNDFATINNVTAHDITLDTGAGNDGSSDSPISIYDVSVKGNVTLLTGAGNDFAYMHSGDSVTSTINGSVNVNMGDGNDNLEIVDQTIGKDLNVTLGNGTNLAGLGEGIGDASGEAEGTLSIGHNLNIYGGANFDEVGLLNVQVHNDLYASLGAGNDELFAEEVTITGNATVDAGAGNDSVSIDSSSVGKTATLLMGAGNDNLTISSSTAAKLVARGGAGNDTFANDLGITKNGKTSNTDVAEFEHFTGVP